MPNTNNSHLEDANANTASKSSSEILKNNQKVLKINSIQLELPAPTFSNTTGKAGNSKSNFTNHKSKTLTKHAFSDGQIVKKSNTNSSKSGNKLKTLNSNNNGQKIKSIGSRTNPESGNSCKASSSTDATPEEVDLLSEQLSHTKIVEGSMFSSTKWIVTPRDSLEKITAKLKNKTESQEIIPSTSLSQVEKDLDSISYPIETELPHSDTVLGNDKIEHSYTKIFGWDPWDKINRKCKRDVKRKKYEKTPSQSRENSKSRTSTLDVCRKDHLAGGELKSALAKSEIASETSQEDVYRQENAEEYRYLPQRKKSVEFTNEVMVIWYTGEEVVRETKEPLKKELEQQLRNKEMRMGHTQSFLMECKGKYKSDKDDYMAAWFKK